MGGRAHRRANRARSGSLVVQRRQGRQRPAALSAAIGCSICGSVLTGGGAGAATTGVAAAGRCPRCIPVPATQGDHRRDHDPDEPRDFCGAPALSQHPRPTSCDTFGSRHERITLLYSPFVHPAVGAPYSRPAHRSLYAREFSAAELLVTLRLCFNRAMPAAFHPAVAPMVRTHVRCAHAPRRARPGRRSRRSVTC